MASDWVLDAGCKAYPVAAVPCAVSQLGERGWNLLQDALAYPVAVLRRPALMHNLRWMALIEDDGRISGAISTHF